MREKHKMKKTKTGASGKAAVLLLALILALTGSFAAPARADGEGASLFSAGKTYAVPLKIYINYTSTAMPSTSNAKVQFNEAAMVTKNRDGTLRVTLRFNSYSIVDAVQIVKPDLAAEAATSYGTALSKMPMGIEGFAEDGAALRTALANAWASEEFDHWHMDADDVVVEGGRNDADRELDFGYLSFDLEESVLTQSVSNRLMVRAFSAAANAAPNTSPIVFDVSRAAEIPESVAAGEHTFGVTHAEVRSASSSGSDANVYGFARNIAENVTLIEKTLCTTASALVYANGEAAIRVGLSEYDDKATYNITAVQRAVRRDLSQRAHLQYLFSEFYAEYEDADIDEGANELVYRSDLRPEDLIFGVLFKFTYMRTGTSAVSPFLTLIRLLPLPEENYGTANAAAAALADGDYTVPAALDGDYADALDSAALTVSGGAIEARLNTKEFTHDSQTARVASIANIGGSGLSATPAAIEAGSAFDFMLPAYDGDPIAMQLTLDGGSEAKAHSLTLDFSRAKPKKIETPKSQYTEFTSSDGKIKIGINADDAPQGAQFSAMAYREYNKEEMTRATRSTFEQYATNAAATEDDYAVYVVKFKDADGKALEPTTFLEFTPPQEWDLSKIVVHVFGFTAGDATTLVRDYENRKILVPMNGAVTQCFLNATVFFVNDVEPLDPTALADGLHKVRIVTKSATKNSFSMSNAVIDHTAAYIEKTGETTRLYMGLLGSVLNMYMYDGHYSDGTRTQAEYLAYISESDGTLTHFPDYENLTEPNRLAFDMAAPADADNTYWVRFDIPAMDHAMGSGIPGDLSGSRDARLFVLSAEKIDGPNPFAGYDKTVIRAQIDIANRLIAAGTLSEAETNALAGAVATAQTAYDDAANLSSDGIKAARDAIAAAIAGIDTTLPVSKAALAAALSAAAGKAETDYTAASYDALRDAATVAWGVYDDEDATQEDVDAQVAALTAAMAALVPKAADPSADTAALEAAVFDAKKFAANAPAYESGAYAALTAAVAAAEKALLTAGLLQEQANAQAAALNASVAALAEKAALKQRLSGEVSLAGKTTLKNYVTPAADSMGNAGIDHSLSKVVIDEEGKAELRLFFKALSTGGFTGYLLDLFKVGEILYDKDQYIESWVKINLPVHSVHEGATDDFGPPEGRQYPREIGVPIDLGQEEVIVSVFVPVMESIQTGSGTQLARLRIDWSAVDLAGGTEVADIAALSLAVDDAKTVVAANYRTESYAALAAGIAAGEYLIANNETLTVTQDMIDARVLAIAAAKAALIAKASSVGVAPEVISNGEDKTTVSTLTEEQAAKLTQAAGSAIDDAKAAAQAGEVAVAEIRIAVDADTLDTTGVTEAVTNIPKTAVAAIVAEASKAENANVEIALTVESALESGVATVTLDNAALAQLAETAARTSDEMISVTVTADATAELTPTQESAVPEGKVPFSVTIQVGDTVLMDLGGAIAVTVPYVKQGDASKKVVVWYVPADGDKAKVDGAVYADGKLTFVTDRI
jgi:hypothetical protein